MENDVTNITLLDEEGNEIDFEVITKLDIEKNEYVIVAPKNGDDNSEAVVLKIDKDEEGNDILYTIEDDEEFNMVSEAYEALFPEGELN
ncbi:hypothetical protein CPAST_c21460 [Clostridium pasteurianum DSM 525 = ATCC 6013]|uniref:UPF0473 protein CLPA_c21460 n=1 Tax=Clostridium pasteurianum DSM 525 = ATCC 6013 TaxID=1262449 RepID=A0A0H3J2S2_CLOPA|nr:DUF1292 domain-containing protein [Clostridium pasteurianum]AJA48216.1 hypothetical protein CPAST_c21460 [Clostridium pasteurianum DSM 525 = ATCC 6013]AJA52204.1 hypothetical protein CLPA_c21460 [Clostridium pasteurianum DSM 525 = ATCC 6013]AOZ75474.1 hypothetical protein AQ983_10420 [Clostridium pasteurianum DSM 525 = ATCC 6013]AOZ79269.1 hypothetical protein AQ984_10410 [Clostridium pasteurianum]ELP60632.1 hypothetical protein F502_04067 [Clostridium pasteurianum DSM 525 = ATCC 6013]